MSESVQSGVSNRPEDDNAAWLAMQPEPVLEPRLPICDPHHHLWDFETHRYLLPELMEDLNSGHNVRSTVFIECTAMYRAQGPEELRSLGETEFVNGAAAMSASGGYGEARVCAAIVGFADLSLGARVEQVLEQHLAVSGGRFRGIRHISAFDPSGAVRRSHTNPTPELLGEAGFREGFGRLHKLGLRFDAWLYHPQIPQLTELAQAFPDQPIVLNHLGGPLGIGPYQGRREEIFPQWREAIFDLALCPNVSVKLGGLGMKIIGYEFHKRGRPPGSEELANLWRPYIETCIEAFTPQRCMFESNFPVDKVSGSYQVYWNAFKRLASGASQTEKAALFHDTAAGFYGLA
ncbi:MAG: amidohydrolase family protein [SAR324 cluster bacterium]|nr:amidohydrolase family protein [SAR324 cluster bacterium]